MIDRDEFERLSRAVESARREHDRAKGREEALLARLQTEHGCGDLKAAKRRIKELESELATLEQNAAVAFAEFKKEWESLQP